MHGASFDYIMHKRETQINTPVLTMKTPVLSVGILITTWNLKDHSVVSVCPCYIEYRGLKHMLQPAI